MSLEQELAKLTKALEENTAALKAGGGSKPASGGSKPASGGTKRTTKKKLTKDGLIEEFGAHMKVSDKDEREANKGHVKAILEHLDCDRITNLPEDQFEEALALLKKYQEGEDPLAGEGEEEDGDLM